jgi:hypothetical protein
MDSEIEKWAVDPLTEVEQSCMEDELQLVDD